MKISKKALLAISGLLSISALGLMFASASDRDLFMDIHNAVQHINEVNVISTGNDGTTAILSNSYGLVKIDTNNFILGETGDKKNIITNDVSGSSILGGENNRIGGGYNVILGGSGNKVGGSSNTILGGEGNNVNARTCGSYNTIIGGKNNIISGGTSTTNNCINIIDQSESSVIIGGHDNNLHGRFSVVMGNNSSVKGNNSVALGSGSHIQANNSFLWTDGNSPETLLTNDVFVIMAQNGAVINTNKAHSFAKLTLGGPLVLSNSDNQSNIQCGQGQGGGIIKMEKSENNQLCLCSCDGSGWNSMFSYGACSKVCNKFLEPPKCGTEVNRICPYRIMYSGSCENGKVIEGTGAYFVDKNDIVHRSCQTSDGQVASCSGTVSQDMQDRQNCMDHIGVCTAGGGYDNEGHSCNGNITCPANYEEKDGECKPIGNCLNENNFYDSSNYSATNMIGFEQPNDRTSSRYKPIGQNLKWKCVDDREPEAHKCEFSCKDGFECGILNGGRNYTTLNIVATCISKTSCAGDYSFLDGSQRKYKILTGDGNRHGWVYKNPTSNNEIFQYSESTGNLEGQEGCFVVCDPGYHQLGLNHTYGKQGYCDANCIDAWGYTDIEKGYVGIKSKGGWTEADSINQRWKWKYLYPDQFEAKIGDTNIGIGEANSCLWTCTGGSIPVIFSGAKNNKHAYTISGELITEFDDFLQNPGGYEMDGSNYHVCRNECNNDEIFEGYRCRQLSKYRGYIKGDQTVTYKGITNTISKKKACTENDNWMIDFTQTKPTCISTSITKESLCTAKNNDSRLTEKGRGPRYYRKNNSCISCPIGQRYITSTNSCQDCTGNEPDCVRDLGS